MLRDMQQDINRRTEAFRKTHPEADKLNEAAKAELQTITRDQKDVAELLDELNRPAGEPEADKGEKK
jgi:hypothetical protein